MNATHGVRWLRARACSKNRRAQGRNLGVCNAQWRVERDPTSGGEKEPSEVQGDAGVGGTGEARQCTVSGRSSTQGQGTTGKIRVETHPPEGKVRLARGR